MAYALTHHFLLDKDGNRVGHEVRAKHETREGGATIRFVSDDGSQWKPIVMGSVVPVGVVKYVLGLRRETDMQRLMQGIEEITEIGIKRHGPLPKARP